VTNQGASGYVVRDLKLNSRLASLVRKHCEPWSHRATTSSSQAIHFMGMFLFAEEHIAFFRRRPRRLVYHRVDN
jgi:hypothetical protein